METVNAVSVSVSAGVHGDYRGGLASTRASRKRQVSLIENACWDAATADSQCPLEWWNSRRNLLVEGLRLPREAGARVAIGATLVVEITDQCDPCERMESLHPGLRAALTPNWRGGFLGRVIEDGEIAVGDEIRIL